MNVTVAKTAGFCFGVKRAVEKVYEQIQKTDKPIYTYGPIIHNEEVVKDLKKKGVEVIGISRDSVASHGRFAQKHSLPFLLLSDPELQAIQAYGVWQEKKLYGKVSMGVVRTTFVIDEQGNIERIMPKVKPDTNAAEILEQL